MKGKSIFAALFLIFALAAGFVGGRAHAQQPHMVNALNHLRNARQELRAAAADKGGHRERAIGIVNDAIAQVEAGIAYGRGR